MVLFGTWAALKVRDTVFADTNECRIRIGRSDRLSTRFAR
jgi:hypothetical protein